MNCFKIFIAHITIFSFFIKSEIDGNSNPNNPASTLDDNRPPPVMSKYDPDLDYEKLLCDLFDEEEKNCPDIKKIEVSFINN
jgi:hypothetical protein